MARFTQIRQTPELDPQAALEEQITTLRLLIVTTPALTPARVHEISPRLAEHVVMNLNRGNRHLKPLKIQQLSDAISRGWWSVTGDTIKFGRFTADQLDQGKGLLDGQNRLSAIALSGRSVLSYIAFGIDSDVFPRIDIGARRSAGDTFGTKGVSDPGLISRATRWLRILEGTAWGEVPDRGLSLTPDELWDHYSKKVRRTRLQEAARHAKVARHGLLPVNSLAALFYKFTEVDEKCAKLFIYDLEKLQRGGRVIIATVQQVKASQTGKSRIHENQYVAWLINGWNVYREGKTQLRARDLDWDITKPFPAIK